MSGKRSHLWIVSTVLLLAAGAILLFWGAGQVPPRATAEVIADARKALSEVKTYSAEIALRVDMARFLAAMAAGLMPPDKAANVPSAETRARTRVAGQVPDRLRIESDIEMDVPNAPGGQKMKMLMIFDGKHQWSEARLGQGGRSLPTQVNRIVLSGLTTTERPFDTGFHLMGSGLFAGEDLPGTVRTLLRLYDLKSVRTEKVDGVLCDVLEGTLNEVAFAAHLRKSRQDPTNLAAQGMKNSMRFARLYFARSDHFIRKYESGTKRDNLVTFASLSKVRLNPRLPADTFSYTPPPGVTVQDVTEQLKTLRESGPAGGDFPPGAP